MISVGAIAGEALFPISRSSIHLDRAKASIYAEAGVAEYWIVDVDRSRVEVHREPVGAGYAVSTAAAPGDTLASTAVPGVVVTVADILRVRR